MKNILIVNDEKQMGGVSVLLEDILNNINYKKQIDLLILHNRGNCLNNLPSNVNIIYGTSFFNVIDLNIKEIIKSKKFLPLLKKIYLVFLMKTGLIKYKIIKERKKVLTKNYDLEISFKDGFCSLFTAYGDSKEKIQWIHTDYSKKDYLEKYRKLFIKIFKYFDKFIAVSEPVKHNFNKIYGQSHKSIVINNYIDDKKVINLSKKDNIKLSDKKFNYISVGRLHYDKGYHILLNVFNKLNKEKLLNDIHFTLVGDGPEYENLLKLTNDYGLNDKITFLGRKSNPFIYVKQADLFILSSFHESFGNVMIEALILGVPIIATEVASVHEILNDNIGMIVKNNEDALYNGLKEIINNPTKLNDYKNNLTNYKYSNEHILKQILKILEK